MAFIVLMGLTVVLGVLLMGWMEYDDKRSFHSAE